MELRRTPGRGGREQRGGDAARGASNTARVLHLRRTERLAFSRRRTFASTAVADLPTMIQPLRRLRRRFECRGQASAFREQRGDDLGVAAG